MRYRVGWPGWKVVAKHGGELYVVARVHRDREAGCYWAESSDLDGLVVSAATMDELHREVMAAVYTLLELELGGRHPAAKVDLRSDLQLCAA